MADVIAFRPRQPKEEDPGPPHFSGEAKCLACQHEWVAVAEVGATTLECPACGLDRGRTKGPCWPEDGIVFVCRCGCDIYVLRRSGAMCIGCGITPTSWVDG